MKTSFKAWRGLVMGGLVSAGYRARLYKEMTAVDYDTRLNALWVLLTQDLHVNMFRYVGIGVFI